MHKVVPYLLTGLSGAAVPTVGVTVLVVKNSSLAKKEDENNGLKQQKQQLESEKSQLETRKQELEKTKQELTIKINRPTKDDVSDAIINLHSYRNPHVFTTTHTGWDQKIENSDGKCLYNARQKNSDTYEIYICFSQKTQNGRREPA